MRIAKEEEQAEELTPEEIRAKLYPGLKNGNGHSAPEQPSQPAVTSSQPHTLTLEEIAAMPEWGAMPGIGQNVPLFEVTKCT